MLGNDYHYYDNIELKSSCFPLYHVGHKQIFLGLFPHALATCFTLWGIQGRVFHALTNLPILRKAINAPNKGKTRQCVQNGEALKDAM